MTSRWRPNIAATSSSTPISSARWKLPRILAMSSLPVSVVKRCLAQDGPSIETPHDALVERRPQAGAHARLAQRPPGPFVAGEDEAVAAIGLVEDVVGAVAAAEQGDWAAAGIEMEAFPDEAGEAAILVVADPDRALVGAGLRTIDVDDVEQGRPAAEEGGEGAPHAEVPPGRRVQIEIAIAVADRDMIGIAPAGIAQMLRLRVRPPIHVRIGLGHDDPGVDAVRHDEDGDALLARLIEGGIGGHRAEQQRQEEIKQRERDDAGEAAQQPGQSLPPICDPPRHRFVLAAAAPAGQSPLGGDETGDAIQG